MNANTITTLMKLSVTSIFAVTWWHVCQTLFSLNQAHSVITLTVLFIVFCLYYAFSIAAQMLFQREGEVENDQVSGLMLIVIAVVLAAGPWILGNILGQQSMPINQSNIFDVMIYRVNATAPFISGAIAAIGFHNIVFKKKLKAWQDKIT